MAQNDSLDKIVSSYFWGVSKRDFTYKGKLFEAKPLHVSPQFFDEYGCKLNCAGCCPRFSLDYIPGESLPDMPLSGRPVNINGVDKPVLSKLQALTPGKYHCDNVNPENGACGIHGRQPFSCDFETLRFTHYKDRTYLGTRPYGRGWNMLRVDGSRGAICDFKKVKTEEARREALRKVRRLKQWCDYFGIESHCETIVSWAESTGLRDVRPLILNPIKEGGVA